MEAHHEAVIDEVRQIAAQYRKEVPGKRKAWPEAIKKRALKLYDSGMSFKEIADRAELPYYTLLTWNYARKHRKASFEPVLVVKERKAPPAPPPATPVTVAVAAKRPALVRKQSKAGPSNAATVTVAVRGMKVEGVTCDFLARLIKLMGDAL